MKKLLIVVPAALLILSSCGGAKEENKNETAAVDTTIQYFGDTITMDGAVAAEQLVAQLQGKDSLKIKLTGKVAEVCQKKGCWMTMSLGGDKTMQIRFKDYGFFVPKDGAGTTAVIEGVAFNDTTSVQELKHYAEDAGKSKEEIEAIKDPEVAISFEAHGVILKK